MEIASNYAVSVAPPSYQHATEEAKRDTRLREQIPEPKQTERSAAQSRVADERGGASSSTATMAAQTQGMQRAGKRSLDQVSAEKKRDSEKPDKSTGRKTGSAGNDQAAAKDERTAGSSGARSTQAGSAGPPLTAVAALAQAGAGTASSISAALAAQGTTSANAETELRADRNNDHGRNSFARFNKESAADSRSGSINEVIARRYNATTREDRRGSLLDTAV